MVGGRLRRAIGVWIGIINTQKTQTLWLISKSLGVLQFGRQHTFPSSIEPFGFAFICLVFYCKKRNEMMVSNRCQSVSDSSEVSDTIFARVSLHLVFDWILMMIRSTPHFMTQNDCLEFSLINSSTLRDPTDTARTRSGFAWVGCAGDVFLVRLSR